MLAAVAAVLVWCGDRRWKSLRVVALAPIAFWIIGLFLAGENGTAIFAFCVGVVTMYLLELLAHEDVEGEEPTGDFDTIFAATLLTGAAASTLASFGTSGWTTAALLLLQAAALALVARQALRGEDQRELAQTFLTAAACFAVVAVPVALSGVAVTLLWGIMAVGFGVIGSRQRNTLGRVASVVVWLLAVVYAASRVENEAWFRTLNVPISPMLLIQYGLAGVGLVLAWLLTQNLPPATSARFAGRRELLTTGRWLAVLAVTVYGLTSLNLLPTPVATIALVLAAWLLAVSSRIAPRLRLALLGIGVACIAAGKWLFVDLLGQRVGDGWTQQQLDYLPILNPNTLLGSLVTGSVVGIYFFRRRELNLWLQYAARFRNATQLALTFAGGLLALLVLAGGLEIDRIITAATPTWPLDTPPARLRQLAFTALALAASAAFAGLALRLVQEPERRQMLFARLAILPALLAGKFVLIDLVLSPRLVVASPIIAVLNFETLVGLVLLGVLALHLWPLAKVPPREPGRTAAGTLLVTFLTIGVVLISLDLWRLLGSLAVSTVVQRAGVSLTWAALAVGFVLVGLSKRLAPLRYYGLVLLAVAAVKVLVYDLATVSRGWRTISFLTVGLLMIAVSVAYAFFGPRLLSREPELSEDVPRNG